MKSKSIAESGLLTALTVVILYSTSLIPISKLSILTLASCLIPICIIRSSVKYAILVYIASSLISLFFVPFNISIYYMMFFGIYGIVKFFIEKINMYFIEIIIKLLSFNVLLMAMYLILKEFIVVNSALPLWLLWIGAQVVFLIYDYALTVLITSFLKRFNNHI